MARLTYSPAPTPTMRYNNNDDLWYNLGQMAGMIWGENYNRRGEQKAQDEADRKAAEFRAMQGQGGQPTAEGLYPTPNTTVTDNGISGSTDGLFVNGQAMGIQQPNNATNGIMVNGQPMQQPQGLTDTIGINSIGSNNNSGGSYQIINPYTNDFLKKKTTSSNLNSNSVLNFQPQRDLKAEKLDYIYNKYNQGGANPVGDNIIANNIGNTVKSNLANISVGDYVNIPNNLSLAQMQAEIRRELVKNGRTDRQIAKAMEYINPTLEATLKDANTAKFDQLYNLMKGQLSRGESDAAGYTWAQMAKLDKDLASAYLPQLKRHQTRVDNNWNNQLKIEQLIKAGYTAQEAQNIVFSGNIGGAEYQRAQLQDNYNKINGVGRYAPKSPSGDNNDTFRNPSRKEIEANITAAENIIKAAEEKPGTVPDAQLKAALNMLNSNRALLVQDYTSPSEDDIYNQAWDAYQNGGLTIDEMQPVLVNRFGTEIGGNVFRRLKKATTPNTTMSEAMKGYTRTNEKTATSQDDPTKRSGFMKEYDKYGSASGLFGSVRNRVF